MHHDVFDVPQIDVGQVVGENALDLRVDLFARVLVNFPASLIDQRIDTRVGVISAIGAVRRELGRMKNILENVRVFITSNPSQRVQLIGTARDIGKESGKFESANVEDNANIAQLLLDYCSHQPRTLFSRSFHAEMQAHAVYRWVSGLIEQVSCSVGIVVVVRYISVVSPTLGRKQTVRR